MCLGRADTRIDCFDFDSKVPASKARQIVGRDISFMGNVNNPQTLLFGTPEDVHREVQAIHRSGIEIIGAECAVPLRTPLGNLKVIAEHVRTLSRAR